MYDIKDVTGLDSGLSKLQCRVEVRLEVSDGQKQIQTKDSTKMIATVNLWEWTRWKSISFWWLLTETSSRHDGGTEFVIVMSVGNVG